jgi:nitrate/nitrite transport system permease protein
MVSAVFHTPPKPAGPPPTPPGPRRKSRPRRPAPPAAVRLAPSGCACCRRCWAWRLLVGLWALVAMSTAAHSRRPRPGQAVEVFSDPFYRNGPNDQGMGWNVLSSCSAWPWASAWRRWWAFRWAS